MANRQSFLFTAILIAGTIGENLGGFISRYPW
jgi:hypothetical protein